MDDLLRQVTRAHRRLLLEQFLRRLTVCLLVALGVAAAAVAAPRVTPLAGLPVWWDAAWLVGASAAAAAVAGGWTAARPLSRLDAAIEIDRRYGLRERVASTLSLPDEAAETEVGRALVGDAVRSVTRVEIGDRFRVGLPRTAWAALAPATLVALLIGFVGVKQAQSTASTDTDPAAQQRVKQSVEELRKKIAERRKRAEKKNLKEADGLLKQIEQGARDLSAKAAKADKKKTLVKLNDLKQQLDKRRQALGGKRALEQQLQNLKNLGKGPAEKTADALRRGDFKKAVDELNKLRKQMAEGKLSDKQREKLAEQLGKMKQRLEQAERDRQQVMEELRRQIDEQRRQGNAQQANELQQKLDKLQQRQQQMEQLQQLAQKMGQAQQAAKNGDQQQAAKAMQQMAEQLQQMQRDAEEMEMLAEAMEMIEAAKQGMQGQPGGEPFGPLPDGFGEGFGEGEGKKPGFGMGKGRGVGGRPDEKNDTAMRDTRVRQKPGRGASVFSGLVDGPNRKGAVSEAIKTDLADGVGEESDPLVEERLPRGHREHAQEFFKQLREQL